MDYNIAFLDAEVEEVYVKMAPGYEKSDGNRVPMGRMLLRSFYGLCQNPSNRWGAMDEHLVKMGFKIPKSDLYVYIYSGGGVIVILPYTLTTLCFSENT